MLKAKAEAAKVWLKSKVVAGWSSSVPLDSVVVCHILSRWKVRVGFIQQSYMRDQFPSVLLHVLCVGIGTGIIPKTRL